MTTIKRLIIAGGRDYRLTTKDLKTLDGLGTVLEVVSGSCRGVDRDGEKWAQTKGIPVKRFPADWSLGPKAGPLRNAEMAEYATAAILFPGGRGTRSMECLAREEGLDVWVVGPQLELI